MNAYDSAIGGNEGCLTLWMILCAVLGLTLTVTLIWAIIMIVSAVT